MCPKCYTVFKKYLDEAARQIHGTVSHTGKIPGSASGHLKVLREKSQLKKDLSKAIEVENFEQAAKLRDRLRELQEKEGA